MTNHELALNWLKLPMHDQIVIENKLGVPNFDDDNGNNRQGRHVKVFKWVNDNKKVKEFAALIAEKSA